MPSSSLFSKETLAHAIAGSCGSVSAMAVTVPLDTARTRLLLDKDKHPKDQKGAFALIRQLIREEGILTLYRGIRSTLTSVTISNFVYFYTFHGLKIMLGSKTKQTAYTDLVFAIIGGTINVLLTNPLWVVNTKIKMQGISKEVSAKDKQFHGLIDGLYKLAMNEGLTSLWSGTIPSLVLVSNPAIKFTVYEFLKRHVIQWKGHLEKETLSPGNAFLVGVAASLAATIITYPVQVVQAKARHGHGFKNLSRDAGMFELFVYIVKNFGFQYLFQGLDAKLLQSVISAGFLFLTYEQISQIIFSVLGIRKKIHN